MKRRPWPIVILALLHFLAPLGNIVLGMALQGSPLFEHVRDLWLEHGWFELVLSWGTMPLAGFAIYAMKRWSYPVFLLAMVMIFFKNFMSWARFPQLFSLPSLILVSVLNIGVVSYFLIPAVRAVYFNPRLRWWESKPRYRLGAAGRLVVGDSADGGRTFDCRVEDVSEGGVFLSVAADLSAGTEVVLEFRALQIEVRKNGTIVYRKPIGAAREGYGVRFVSTLASRREMKRVARTLKRSGVEETRPTENWLVELKQWLVRLVTTGRGLVPEVPKQPHGR